VSSECKTKFDRIFESLERKTLAELANIDEEEHEEDEGGSGWGLPVLLIGLPLLASLFSDRSGGTQ